MLIVEGYVTKSGLETWTNEETGETGETFRFSVEGLGMIPDDSIDKASLPAVGQRVRAMVNRVWSSKKKREFFFVLGFENGNGLAAA
jgi:hypothetical protein